MTSESNHSPALPTVSSPRFSITETTAETSLFTDLIVQAERAADWLLEIESCPRRQAAIDDLVVESHRATDALLAYRQDVGYLPPHGGTP